LEYPPCLLVSHWGQFRAVINLLSFTIFASRVRGYLFFFTFGHLVLRDGCPDAELGDGRSLGACRRLSLDRVDQRRGQGLVIGIRPLWLRHNLFDIFA